MTIEGAIGVALVDYTSGLTLDSQYHLIRLLQDKCSGEALFLYLALNKNRANLGLARHQLRKIESELEI